MERGDPQITRVVRMQRDAHMTLLLAQVTDLIQQLALLAGPEKAAVTRMVVIGQAMAYYTRSAGADLQVIASFDRLMSAFSPLFDSRAGLATARATYLEQTRAGMDTQIIGPRSEPGPGEHNAANDTASEAESLNQYLKTLIVAVVSPPASEPSSAAVARRRHTPR